MAAKPKFDFQVHKQKFDAFIREYTANMSGPTQDAMIRKIAFDLLEIIIHNTPVDTGRARAGWTAWADRNGLGYDISGPEVTAQQVRQGKSEGTFSDRTTQDGTRIIFINAVPYIIFLEYGHSDQASHGMVRFAMSSIMAETLNEEEKAALKKSFAAANKRAKSARSK